MSGSSLLVTGASGHLGRRVVELLLDQGAGPIIATSRTPDSLKDLAARGVEVRRADFDDEASLVAAFRGAGRALLVSTDALDRPGRRAAQHRTAIRALETAGVGHVVYTSAPGVTSESTFSILADHRDTEAALAESRLDFTVLRNSLYTELWLQALPQAVGSGQLIDARGAGKVAFVTRDDCARAAAGALASTFTGRRTLEVTGPALLTSDEVATLVADLAKRPITHVSVSPDALVAGLVGHGIPAPFAAVLAGFDEAIEKGYLATSSAAVRDLTGREPQSVRDFLLAHRGAWS